MSRAFVKETAASAPPPERMVEDGPNLVTQEGFAQIAAHVARIENALKSETNELLRETLERDLRYWSLKKASAEVVAPPGDGSVAFGPPSPSNARSTTSPANNPSASSASMKPIPLEASSLSAPRSPPP
ncbi:MAG TPA: hypothetical protein VMS78_04995 [Rhizomicrobium sp.]|nr:hypothetical protein [Rhizomicrobium sp.]